MGWQCHTLYSMLIQKLSVFLCSLSLSSSNWTCCVLLHKYFQSIQILITVLCGVWLELKIVSFFKGCFFFQCRKMVEYNFFKFHVLFIFFSCVVKQSIVSICSCHFMLLLFILNQSLCCKIVVTCCYFLSIVFCRLILSSTHGR